VPETVQVDNNPVSVGFTLANDPQPGNWVNHSVTVNVSASEQPSGLVSADCAVDGGSKTPFPVSGTSGSGAVTVNGTGTHSVMCEAQNNAHAVDNSTAWGAATTPLIHIDETPPSLSFKARNPADPDQVVIDTTDGQSGVGGGSVQIQPTAGGAWETLQTQFDGKHLLARIDDASLPAGAYTVQATSCDQVGNCGSTTETVNLPLRVSAASQVSFQRIADPMRTVVHRKRVRVGWRWVKVRRHGKLVRVKRGGHRHWITTISQVERCTRTRRKVGKHRWRQHTTCHPPHVVLRGTERVKYGASDVIHGRLVTGQDVPIAGAPVEVLTAPDDGLNQFTPLTTVTTGVDGGWAATLPPGSSRLVQAVYGGSSTMLPASSSAATLIVPARIRLRVSPRHLRWGGTVRISGQILGGHIPSNATVVSQLLRLRIGHGKAYRTIGIPDVDRSGRFATTTTIGGCCGTAHVWLAVWTLAETNFPFAPAHSRLETVKVGPR
jgi:hypothetical protein